MEGTRRMQKWVAGGIGSVAALAVLSNGAAAATLPGSTSSSTPTLIVSSLLAPLTNSPTSAGPAPAPTAVGQGAPAGSASGAVLRIDPLRTCVSCSQASAGRGGSSAGATPLRLLGHDLAGGTSTTGENGSGAMFVLIANPLIKLALLDWLTAASAGGAHSRTAVADVAVAGGRLASVTVLESQSNASWTPAASHSGAATNGAVANVGQGAVVVVLLHSNSSSNGSGKVYVASINGNEILSSQQTGGGIPINIPGVATIDLLFTRAAGGVGTTGNVAAGGQVSALLGQRGEQVLVFGAATNAGTRAHTTPVEVTRVANHQAVSAVTAARGSAAPTPNTGAALGLAGLLLLGAGAALASGARRRRHV